MRAYFGRDWRARAGVCLTTARDAVRAAASDGLLVIEERRRNRAPNLANVVRIVSREWRVLADEDEREPPKPWGPRIAKLSSPSKPALWTIAGSKKAVRKGSGAIRPHMLHRRAVERLKGCNRTVNRPLAVNLRNGPTGAHQIVRSVRRSTPPHSMALSSFEGAAARLVFSSPNHTTRFWKGRRFSAPKGT